MAWTATIDSVEPERDHLIAVVSVSDGTVSFKVNIPLNSNWTATQAKAGIKEHLAREQPSIIRAKQAQSFVGQSITL